MEATLVRLMYVSLHSEADQLCSEIINVSVTIGSYALTRSMWLIGVNVLYFPIKFSKSHADDADAAIGTAMCFCASEVGIAVGAVIVVVCLLVTAW